MNEPILNLRRKKKVFVVNNGKPSAPTPAKSKLEAEKPKTEAANAKPEKTKQKQPSKKKRLTRRERTELIAELAEDYPDLFCDPPKPLAIGITDILVKLPKYQPKAKQIKQLLSYWCKNYQYRQSVAKGGSRYGINGEKGKVTHTQQSHAQQWLERAEKRRERNAQKAKLKESAAPSE